MARSGTVLLYTHVFRERWNYPRFEEFRRVISDEMATGVGPLIVGQFNDVVADWKVQPKFTTSYATTAAHIQMNLIVGGAGKPRWFWVDKGVEGRDIVPRRHRQPPLRHRIKGRSRRMFRSPTNAALRFPGLGGGMIFRKMVHWTGIRARHNTERIVEEFKPEFQRRMENAIRRGMRAAARG